jgi:hypothetical protein
MFGNNTRGWKVSPFHYRKLLTAGLFSRKQAKAKTILTLSEGFPQGKRVKKQSSANHLSV